MRKNTYELDKLCDVLNLTGEVTLEETEDVLQVVMTFEKMKQNVAEIRTSMLPHDRRSPQKATAGVCPPDAPARPTVFTHDHHPREQNTFQIYPFF